MRCAFMSGWVPVLHKALLGLVCATGLLWASAHAGLAADKGGPVEAKTGHHGLLSPEPTEKWQFRFAPYGWLMFLKGQQTVLGRTVDIDTNIFEIIDESDSLIGWMSHFEAQKGRYGFFLDVVYGKIGSSGEGVVSFGTDAAVGGTLGASLGFEYEFATVEFGGFYELYKAETGGSLKDYDVVAGYTAVDLLVGGRYWYQRIDLDFAIAGTLNLGGLVISGSRAIARSGSVDWVDPFVGLRLRHQHAPGRLITLRGDIGGFGASSDFTWQVIGTYGWQFSDAHGINWSGVIGYRLLDVDYSEGAGTTLFRYDVLQHGPIIGLGMSW